MVGLLITGHGHFATGLGSSLRLITGNTENIEYVDFEADHSTETLAHNLNQAFDKLKDCDGVLVLSDLAGGSPFKTAVECKFARPEQKIEVIAGSNLPMLIEAVNLRAMGKDISEIVAEAVENGKEGIHNFMGEYGQSLSVS